MLLRNPQCLLRQALALEKSLSEMFFYLVDRSVLTYVLPIAFWI